MSAAERALARFKRNLDARNSHPLAAALSDLFAEDSFALDVMEVEAEASFLIGARVPCDRPHGEEPPEGFVPEVLPLSPGPCPSCGAAV